jgi:hypothetical protein
VLIFKNLFFFPIIISRIYIEMPSKSRTSKKSASKTKKKTTGKTKKRSSGTTKKRSSGKTKKRTSRATKKRSTNTKKKSNGTKKKSNGTKKRSSGVKKCPTGQILKEGYTTKRGVKVPATCVVKRGRPGVKGPKLIKIDDSGLLKPFGYSLSISKEDRRKSLNKAIKEYGELKIIRYVNAIRTLQKSYPTIWKKLDNDVKYIEKQYFPNRKGWKKSVAKPYSKKERTTPRTKKEVSDAEKKASKKKSKKKAKKESW